MRGTPATLTPNQLALPIFPISNFRPQLAATSTTAEPSSSASATSSSSASSVPLPANIRVAVRVRPENAAEEANGAHRNVVEIVDERMLVFDPKQVNRTKI